MNLSFSLAVHVRNQNKELKEFLATLESEKFTDELIVVVIGGEDPYETLEGPRDFTVKAFYIERKLDENSIMDARRIALAAAQAKTVCFMDVRTKPTKKNILSAIKKESGKILPPSYRF